ncbi:hypothetical protein ACRYI5_09935 [Furfurilactobacillus sp. WILCCON 0119]|uniref:hypothetical protein n=1 Tax=Furfurilactobacillus entadae TaxID=2922307 RepID=UPI0035E6CCDB
MFDKKKKKKATPEKAKSKQKHLSINEAQTLMLDAITRQFGDSQTALPDFSVTAGWACADFIAFRSFDVAVKVGVTPENSRDKNRLKIFVAIGPRLVPLNSLLETAERAAYKRECTPENLATDMKLLEHYLTWRLTPEQREKFNLTK